MRITARLIVALALAAAAVVAGATYLQMRGERARLLEDFERRGSILAESIDTAVDPAHYARDRARIGQFITRFTNRGRLTGIVVTGAKGELLAATPSLRDAAPAVEDLARQAMKDDQPAGRFLTAAGAEQHAYAVAMHSDEDPGLVTGAVVVFQDTAQMKERLHDVWRNNFARLLTQVFLLALVSLWIVRFDILAPVSQMAEWMKRQRAGDDPPDPLPAADFFGPMTR